MAVDCKIIEGIDRCKKKHRDIAKHLKTQGGNTREIVFDLNQDIDKKLNSLVRSYEKELDNIIESEGVVRSATKKEKSASLLVTSENPHPREPVT